MTREPDQELLAEFVEKMKVCARDEPEDGHGKADDVLCALVRQLGYGEVASIFETMTKWYA